jgi:hypothetical protein
MVVWKRLGVSRCGLGPLLGHVCLPAIAMDEGSIEQGSRQARMMRQLPGQGERFVAPPQRLIGIPEQLQGLRHVGQAPHRQVNAGAEGQGAMLLGIVERDTLLQVGARRDDLAMPE